MINYKEKSFNQKIKRRFFKKIPVLRLSSFRDTLNRELAHHKMQRKLNVFRITQKGLKIFKEL